MARLLCRDVTMAQDLESAELTNSSLPPAGSQDLASGKKAAAADRKEGNLWQRTCENAKKKKKKKKKRRKPPPLPFDSDCHSCETSLPENKTTQTNVANPL